MDIPNVPYISWEDVDGEAPGWDLESARDLLAETLDLDADDDRIRPRSG